MTAIRRFADSRPALLALTLGVLAACGFAPLGLWPLTLACLAAWLWLVHNAPTIGQALWRGWAFGVGQFTINSNWFQHAFEYQDKMPPLLGYAAPVALALYLAVYPAIAAGLGWRFRLARVDSGYVLVFGAAWIVTEWLRATLFSGYAWDPLGVIWVPVQPIVATGAWVGTYALSGLTVALAGSALLLPRRRVSQAIAGAAFVGLIVMQALSYQTWATPSPPETHPRLVVVQPNISQDERGDSDGALLIDKLSALSGKPGAAPRLVLWPEGVVRGYIEDFYPDYAYGGVDPRYVRAQMARLLGPRDRLMTGGTTLQFNRRDEVVSATNATFAVDPEARIVGRYDKAHLVPYGEYLPMPWLLKPLGLARLVPGDFDFMAGSGPRALPLPGFGAIGVQTCYEIIFSGQVIDQAQRPRLLFNPSNDAWFGSWGPPQHLAQARMRAIEEGLPIVRATPNGISAVIAADGRLIATVPHRIAGTIDVPMPDALPPTLFSRLGNWMAAIVAALLLLGAVAIRRRER